MTSPNSTEQIMRAVRQLNEGDRVRVLKFVLAILQDRAGKRQQRRSRFQDSGSAIDHWRIGN